MRACLYAGLSFGLSLVASCDASSFWQRFSEPNAGNCMVTACGDGQTCNSATQTCEASFDLTAVQPNLGPSTGGTRLMITGTNLRPDLAVRFGGPQMASATNVSFIDSTHIEATLPGNPSSTWAVPVTLAVQGQSVSKSGLFSYYSPAVTFAKQDLDAIPMAGNVAVGDFNHDMQTDLVFASSTGSDSRITTLVGKGDGTFNSGPTLLLSNQQVLSIMLSDLNGDGYPDLLAACVSGLNIALNNQQGGFGAAQFFQTDAMGSMSPEVSSVAIGDWNGDGKLDLAIANQGANNVSLMLANSGSFSLGAPMPIRMLTRPHVVLTGDWNGDGKPDLIISSQDTPLEVYFGDGTGAFVLNSQPSVATCDPMKVRLADLNADGRQDLIVLCSPSNTVRILLANEPRAHNTFRAPTYTG